ncbi:MAG: LamG domain-containing protein, partial [Bacteroidota bacterium]|nr:LamG domain-containing protein [Bacteroidota bacterium]
DTGRQFDATDVDVFTDSFTISAWIKSEDGHPASVKTIGSYTAQDAVWVRVSTTGTLVFSYKSDNNDGNDAETGVVFSNGQESWHHVVFVADSTIGGVGGKKIYLDGEEQTLSTSDGSTSGVTFADFATDYNFFIGALNNQGSMVQGFTGELSNPKLRSRALSADEIKLEFERERRNF